MRLVHIIDSGGFYGAEVMLVNLCRAQQQLDLDVEVISIRTKHQSDKPLDLKLREFGIKVTPWPMQPLPDLFQALKILRYCEKKSANIIHSHGYKGNILLGLLPRFLRKLPVLSTIHGYTKQRGFGKLALYQWLDKRCLGRLDAVVLVSPSMRHQIPEKSVGRKLHIVPNGIPALDGNARNDEYHSLFAHRDFKIGTVGRLAHEKNFRLLIETAPLILEKLPRAKFIIYGEGGERNKLEQLIKNYNLEDRVVLPGYLHNTPAFFADLDLFINCSMTEGMPISILEAMRQGCLLLASDIPANRFLMEEAATTQLLFPLDKNALADKVLTLATWHADLTQKVSAGFKDHFQQHYTLHKMAQDYRQIYTELIAKTKG